MQSVFERHKDDVELYQRLLGEINGSLFLAMAILSDVQEMLTATKHLQEVSEAKELVVHALDLLINDPKALTP